ncbi:hypothetical protein TsFJ059_001699 [Trichoderma semiorbis]|nr:hypothetical protein TsFJ059_001699 [Trichoderma semiorbis]
MFHNSQLALTLQGAQNSSLERIEKQHLQTDRKLDELRQLLVSDRAPRDRPMLTAPLDTNALMELTDAFLQKAEFDNRPWASIGIDSWLQIGQWWLMKAESQLGVAPESRVYDATCNQGYTNLLKACWILTDIIATHPQRTHMGASNDRRAYHIQRLTQATTSKLNTLSMITFQLKDLLTCNLDIWNLPPSTALTLRRRNTDDQHELKWQTYDGQLLFQGFAKYQNDERELPVECIVIVVMPIEQRMNPLTLNLIVQNSLGQDIYKRRSISDDNNEFLDAKDFPIRFFTQQDERFLKCILHSLHLFRRSPKPLLVDASIIYSAALLRTCVNAGKSLLDRTFEFSNINADVENLIRSRHELQIQPTTHTSSMFQQTVDRLVKYIKRCSEGFPKTSDRMFWMQRHHCDWMLIYWLCDTFEAFSALFDAIGFRSPDFHPVSKNCLIGCSLIRKDMQFPAKFFSFTDLKLDRTFDTVDIMLLAISIEDTVLLRTEMKKSKQMHRGSWEALWEHAYTHFKWGAIEILMSGPYVEDFLQETISWLVEHHHWDELQKFSDLIQFNSTQYIDTNSDPGLDDSHEWIVDGCAELIYQGRSSQDLELLLDIAQRLGVISDASNSAARGWKTQLAILPALASRKLSLLKLISQACIVSSSKEAIGHSIYQHLELEQSPSGYSPSHHDPLAAPCYPLDLAIAFVLDLEIIGYLRQTGAYLHMETVKKLHNTRSLADARKQSCHMKGLFYQICSAEFWKRYYATEIRDPWFCYTNTMRESLAKILMTTGRILFESDCRHLYNITDTSSGSTWQTVQKELYPAELKDAPIPMATSWPAPLSTQESWHNWRLKAIGIIHGKA